MINFIEDVIKQCLLFFIVKFANLFRTDDHSLQNQHREKIPEPSTVDQFDEVERDPCNRVRDNCSMSEP